MTETVITSSVLIFVVILLRTVFKGRIKNRVRYGLWLIAAARLLMPFSLAESSVSVMNFFGSIGTPEIFEEAGGVSEAYDMPSAGNIDDIDVYNDIAVNAVPYEADG